MKKLILTLCFSFLWIISFAQSTGTIQVRFYVDANNNCQYNLGEQVLTNLPVSFKYVTSNGGVLTATIWPATNCGEYLVTMTNPSVTATNTLEVTINPGISTNTQCAQFNNLSYNTNTIINLPIHVNTTNLGMGHNWIGYRSTPGQFVTNTPGTNSMGVCSNIVQDSFHVYFDFHNLLHCNNTSMSSIQSLSMSLDGVVFATLTFTPSFTGLIYATSSNSLVILNGLHNSYKSNFNIRMFLPTTFTALGVHTLEVVSSPIYNYNEAAVQLTYLLHSVPCSNISGKFYVDCNSNCQQDQNEMIGFGNVATGLIYNSASGFNATFQPNQYDGSFSIYLPASSAYSLTQYPAPSASPTNYTACTTGTLHIPSGTSTNTLSFGYKTNQVSTPDPMVVLSRLSSTTPSANPNTGVTFGLGIGTNLWNSCLTTNNNPGILKVALPKYFNYISTLSGPTPTFVLGSSTDTLIWSVPNFSQSTASFLSTFSSFSAVISNTAVAGTNYTLSAIISPSIDNNLANNIYYFTGVIGGPYDPNDKTTEAAGQIGDGNLPFGTTQFFYNIRFQNTGTGPAINIKILDTMDLNFDLSTLEVLQSSFPVSVQRDPLSRLVVFAFDSIQLPAAITNEPKSHGFVRYGIELKPGVPVNTVLKNRAHIYFDYNEPIQTNQTYNQLVDGTGLSSFSRLTNLFQAIPNPVSETLLLTSDIELSIIQVYDYLGNLLHETKGSHNSALVDFKSFSPGIYIVLIQFHDGRSSNTKVIKN